MTHMKTLKLFTAASAIATLLLPQAQAQVICSCSPIEYNFQLNFDGKCDEGATSSSPDDLNKGDAPVCFYTLGSTPDDSIDFGPPPDDVRRLLEDSKIIGGGSHDIIISSHHEKKRWEERALSHLDFSSHIKHAQRFSQQQQQKQRKTQDFDTTPTVITSVSFLEFDYNIQDIINQDSTYFDTTLANGAVVDFTSISTSLDPEVPLEDQMEFVPGGVMLVLFGINAEEEVIQNTVAWSYDSDSCSFEAPLEVVDNGWVELSGFTPAKSTFCPASVPTTTTAATEVIGATTEEAPAGTTKAPDGTDTTTTKEDTLSTTTTDADATSSSGVPVFDAKAGKSAKAENASALDAKAAKGSKSAKAAETEEPTTKSAKAEKGESSTSKAETAVVLDAKAEKGSKVAKAFDVAKAAKLQKTDTASKSKSSKGVIDSSNGAKSSKASRDDSTSDTTTPAPTPSLSRINPEEPTINNNTRPPVPGPTTNTAPNTQSPTTTPLAPADPELTPFPTVLADRTVGRSGENGVKFGKTKDGSSTATYSAATAVAGNNVGGRIFIAMVLLERFYWIL